MAQRHGSVLPSKSSTQHLSTPVRQLPRWQEARTDRISSTSDHDVVLRSGEEDVPVQETSGNIWMLENVH